MSQKEQRREDFIKAVAVLIAGPTVAQWSIGIQLHDPLALAVRDVRATTRLFGYPSIEEAEAVLRELLSVPTPEEPR